MRFVHSLGSIVVVSATVFASAVPAHFAISPEQVAIALGSAGIQVDPTQVALLSAAVATSTTPNLKVRTVAPSGDHTALVRIECLNARECLPFFVRIQTGSSGDALAAPLHAEQHRVSPHQQASARSVVVRAGSQAVLLLESERVHIRIPVICVENGATGERIRVKGTLNRLTYTAEVVDANLLKGSL